MQFFRFPIVAIAWLLAPAFLAADEIDDFIGRIVDPFARLVKQRGESTYQVKFSGLSSFPSGSEAAFVEKFNERMKKTAPSLNPGRSKIVLVGKFVIPNEDIQNGAFQLRIRSIVEENGEEIDKIPVDGAVTDPKTMAEWLGLTLEFLMQQGGRDGISKEELQRKGAEDVAKALKRKTFFVSTDKRDEKGNPNTIVALSGEQGTFGVAVVVGNQHREMKEGKGQDEGRAFIPLSSGESYGVELINNAPYEIAVDLKIDGINVFHFSPEGRKKFHYWVLAPRSRGVIPGWYINPKLAKQFKLGAPENSAAAKAGLTLDRRGQITATFHASWSGQASPPPDEPLVRTTEMVLDAAPPTQGGDGRNQLPRATAREVILTGFGADVSQDAHGVKRTFGQARATITCFYDHQ